MTNKRDIYVYAHWKGMKEPFFMGTLHTELLRGKEVFAFDYSTAWLNSDYTHLLDPDLQLYPGMQYLGENSKANFGLFMDSAPDRWGRLLMRRREAAIARKEVRNERHLYETDYLLGVYDLHRMGALRFKEKRDGPFMNHSKNRITPPFISIGELEVISRKLEKEDVLDDPEYLNWLNMIMAPGSSLGGARPKASIVDKENNLWIAKFPSRYDQSDIGGWEMVVYEMAIKAGIKMAQSTAKCFTGKHHTFMTRRFDRASKNERIHFASAMTLLGYTDGQDFHDGVSYLDLVEFINFNGANVRENLEELWRRIVFSVCVSNTDDHLRNHGFLLTPGGWILSPAYDINPVETGMGLKLNISENDNDLDLDLAMDVHPYFRLEQAKAIEILNDVKQSVAHWKHHATKWGIPMSPTIA